MSILQREKTIRDEIHPELKTIFDYLAAMPMLIFH